MSLIICSECGKEFSDKAVSCPNCGCPTNLIVNNDNAIFEEKTICPECKCEIKIGIDTCPECGFPLDETEEVVHEANIVNISRKKILIYSCVLYVFAALCFVHCFTLTHGSSYDLAKSFGDGDSIFKYHMLALAFCLIGIVLIIVGVSIQRGSKPKSKERGSIASTTSPSSPTFYTTASSSEIRCPKCGSTQIQMVPRKWSLLTGFATNKVDRVCMKCKHRF